MGTDKKLVPGARDIVKDELHYSYRHMEPWCHFVHAGLWQITFQLNSRTIRSSIGLAAERNFAVHDRLIQGPRLTDAKQEPKA